MKNSYWFLTFQASELGNTMRVNSTLRCAGPMFTLEELFAEALECGLPPNFIIIFAMELTKEQIDHSESALAND